MFKVNSEAPGQWVKYVQSKQQRQQNDVNSVVPDVFIVNFEQISSIFFGVSIVDFEQMSQGIQEWNK